MSMVNKSASTILEFLDWAVSHQELELHVNHAKPFTSEVDLPAGWGSDSSDLVSVKIYYRANKVSRSYLVELLKEWSSL